MSLEVLCERHNIPFGVADLLRAYYLKAHLSDRGRYQLTTRGNGPPLITSLKSGDKRWKDCYFFVPFVSLGLPADSRVPCSWSTACEFFFYVCLLICLLSFTCYVINIPL